MSVISLLFSFVVLCQEQKQTVTLQNKMDPYAAVPH